MGQSLLSHIIDRSGVVGGFLNEKDQYIKFYMFPFYYGWLPDSKTVFVFLVAQVFQEVVSFESYISEFNVN